MTGPVDAVAVPRPARAVADRGAAARLSARLTDVGYAAGWRAVRMLPEPVARGAFDRAGRRAAGRDGRGVRQLRANLRVATGGRLAAAELDDLTVRAVRSYARYWQEVFRLPTLGTERILAGTEVRGIEHLARCREQGRGIIAALPHSGNWDAAGAWFVDWLDGPFLTVAERLRPESLYRRFLAYRESLGMRVVPLTGGPRPSSAVLREWLAAGGASCLLVDRDLGSGGVPVSFFGRPATMPGGPAVLADQTGAGLFPVVGRFDGDGWQLDVLPEVPLDGGPRLRDRVATAMQAVADAFTAGIAERPEDWHMLGRIWADVPADPPRRAAAGRPREDDGRPREDGG
ncbi:phosphatidylinositol mannoside acyltransferase [Geodermatophilus sp. YIM 151500]|uniref:phosphatidylinositol mannoside acyltransferase n=1 Tax=Geodermatophilus sp. YIM 151500 TaxID=2984531 RepID=UPI0021E37BBA|nr:phosphatidylinositol mannoside acyltransferase [Geodermatophilus sp. YIM 151500]MCV2491426.1 phosphatidylinositol mannoside acyltransferase [Geodermatophilus sp. YIM 151500]